MNLKKAMSALLAVGVMLMAFTACNGSTVDEIEPKPYPVSVNNMEFTQAPNSIASLSPAITRILCELGYQGKIVGYSSDYEGEGATEQNRIGTGLEPDMEAIGKVAPEIVFTTVPFTNAQLEKLSTVNIRVMVTPTPTGIEAVKQLYVDIVTMMGGSTEQTAVGGKVTAEIDRQLQYVQANVPARQSFLYIASMDPAIVTGDTIQSAVASYIGDNVAASYTGYDVSAEVIPTLAPEIILYDSGIDPEQIKANELFSGMTAVTEGKMFPVKGSDMALSTMSLVEAVQSVASTVHSGVNFKAPAAASAPDTSSEVSSEAASE